MSVVWWIVVGVNTILVGLVFAYLVVLRGEVLGVLKDPEKRFKLARPVDAREVAARRRALLVGARK
jgi:hypothetical protein